MLSFFMHSWLTVLLLLLYMGMVIVVLLNVLIAQLSFKYSEAKSNAKLQYAIDKMSIIARLEQMTFGIVSMIVSFKDRCCFFTIYFHLCTRRKFHLSNSYSYPPPPPRLVCIKPFFYAIRLLPIVLRLLAAAIGNILVTPRQIMIEHIFIQYYIAIEFSNIYVI